MKFVDDDDDDDEYVCVAVTCRLQGYWYTDIRKLVTICHRSRGSCHVTTRSHDLYDSLHPGTWSSWSHLLLWTAESDTDRKPDALTGSPSSVTSSDARRPVCEISPSRAINQSMTSCHYSDQRCALYTCGSILRQETARPDTVVVAAGAWGRTVPSRVAAPRQNIFCSMTAQCRFSRNPKMDSISDG